MWTFQKCQLDVDQEDSHFDQYIWSAQISRLTTGVVVVVLQDRPI